MLRMQNVKLPSLVRGLQVCPVLISLHDWVIAHRYSKLNLGLEVCWYRPSLLIVYPAKFSLVKYV